jgi:hypothetical protein
MSVFVRCLFALLLPALSLATGLAAAEPSPLAGPRQFTLDCVSTDASARRFAIDVNLDLGSHYSDFHGLGPLGEADAGHIVFRIPDADPAKGFKEDEYLTDTGELFWDPLPQAGQPRPAPGAICKASPPRPGFGATKPYPPAGKR